jgi:hypothetical protein
MAITLDKITKSNFLSKGRPYIHVYSGWYNAMVDAFNTVFGTGGLTTSGGGLTTSVSGQMPNLPLPYAAPPSLYHYFFDDFDLSVASAAPTLSWTNVKVGTGTSLLTDNAGGVLTMTCQATTDNSTELNYLQQESFRLATGKKLWYEVRFRCPCADVTDLDIVVGLMVTEDIKAVADNKPANGIIFMKTDDAAGTIYLNSSDNNTDIVSPASIKTLVTNTWTRLGFYFDGGATGLATLTPYVDGVAKQPLTAITYATQSEMCPVLMVRNGDATETQIMDVDYVYIVQER